MDVSVSLLLLLVAKLSAKEGRVGLWMARRKTGDDRLQHSHRVRLLKSITLVRSQEVCQLGVYLIVCPDTSLETQELLPRWKLSVDQQESSLREIGAHGQLVNGDSSVLKDTFLTVNVRNARDAVDRVHVGRVERSSD